MAVKKILFMCVNSEAENVLATWATTSCSRRILSHG